MNTLRWLPLLVGVLSGGCTCSPPAATLEGLECDDLGNCADGYVCDKGSTTCIAVEDCVDEDQDGWCASSDCDDTSDQCTGVCIDGDSDGVPGCAGDVDDSNPRCTITDVDVDGDRWCPPLDCDDDNPNCRENCEDADADGYCAGIDCDEDFPECTSDCTTSTDYDAIGDCHDECYDFDQDGFGDGSFGNAGCIVSQLTDVDDSNASRCGDTDGDECDDCSSGSFDPLDDGLDGDTDGTCDLSDTCTDDDEDGVGTGTNDNVGCPGSSLVDPDDQDPTVCGVDIDGDTCDDCSAGSGVDPANDGDDEDSDGACDAGDDGLGNANYCGIDVDDDWCDDCIKGYWNPADDGTDVDKDGWCDARDCDDTAPGCLDNCDPDLDADGVPDCADDCIDVDRDGYGTSGGGGTCETDCNDLLSVCHAQCDNTDGDSQPDCVEIACGSLPNDPADECMVVKSGVLTLEDAITAANGTNERDKLLVLDAQSGLANMTIVDNKGCLELRSIAPFTFSGNNKLTVQGDGCLFEGLDINDGEEALKLEGDNIVVRDSKLTNVDRKGISIAGANNQIVNNTIINTDDGCADDRAGIFIRETAVDTLVLGNVIDGTLCSGVSIDGSTRTILDYNTIVDADWSGIYIYSTKPSDLCIRYNVVAWNASSGGAAVYAAIPIDGAFSSTCATDVDGNALANLGNWEYMSTNCGGCQNGCDCFPSGFWGTLNADPELELNRCPTYDPPTTESALIDAGTRQSYHTDSGGPLEFVGTPDIGGREHNSTECPIP